MPSTITYVALSAVSVPVPASDDGKHHASRHLVGLGLLVAQRRERRWRFRRLAAVIPAGVPEAALLTWLAGHVPAAAVLIGWNIDHGIMPLLLDAAEGAPPKVAHATLERLLPLLRRGVVDLALPVGGAGAPPFATIALEQAIYAPTWNPAALESGWALGRPGRLRHDLADEASALWRLFLRRGGLTGVEAEAATDAWVARRQQLVAHQLRHHATSWLEGDAG